MKKYPDWKKYPDFRGKSKPDYSHLKCCLRVYRRKVSKVFPADPLIRVM